MEKMLVDGWKWKAAAGSVKRPTKKPLFCKAMCYYHSQAGIEKQFKRYVYERLDNDYDAYTV